MDALDDEQYEGKEEEDVPPDMEWIIDVEEKYATCTECDNKIYYVICTIFHKINPASPLLTPDSPSLDKTHLPESSLHLCIFVLGNNFHNCILAFY